MARPCPIHRIIIACAAACAVLMPAVPGFTQTFRPTLPSTGLPRPKAEPPPRRQAPAVLPEEEDDKPRTITEDDSEDEDKADEEDLEGLDADAESDSVVRTSRAALAKDGDMREPRGPRAPVDGVVASGEAEPIQDGGDMSKLDARLGADRTAFETPRTGFEPELFQVELEPILDRRPAKLARFEPFDAVGIQVGKFLLLPEVQLGTRWQSNVLRTSPRKPDASLFAEPSVRLISNWTRHALELSASGRLSAHDQFASEDDRAYTLDARGHVDVTRRTSIEGGISRDVAQESRSSLDASLRGSARGDVTSDRGTVALKTRYNRLSLQLRGSIAAIDYAGNGTSGGSVNNSDRNVTINEQTLRATWEFKPAFLAFAEFGLNQRDHRVAAFSDGINRSSEGERIRVGLGFGNNSARLRGEGSVGWGRQRTDRRLADIDGMLLDANLAWRIDGLNSLLLTARTDVTETTLAGSGGAMTRAIGLEGRHAFLPNLIGVATIGTTIDDYRGRDLTERELKLGAGLEHYISREAMTFGRIEHTAFSSTDSARSYAADEVRLGVRLVR